MSCAPTACRPLVSVVVGFLVLFLFLFILVALLSVLSILKALSILVQVMYCESLFGI